MRIILFILLLNNYFTFNIDNNPTFNLKLMLKTGDLIEGDLIKLADNIATIKTKEQSLKLPLSLFLPKAKQFILDIAPSIPKQNNLKEGQFGLVIDRLTVFAELRQLQNEALNSVIVFIDPTETLQKTIINFANRSPLLKNNLSYIEKKQYGANADLYQIDLISKQYNLTLPAILIVQKDKPIISHSSVLTANQVNTILEPQIKDLLKSID